MSGWEEGAVGREGVEEGEEGEEGEGDSHILLRTQCKIIIISLSA